MTGISITALRYYDREQVLVPEIRNENNGYRYYSFHQLERAQTIRDLKSLGLSLEEIREILEKKSRRQLEESLLKKTREIEAEIGTLESRLLSAQNAYRISQSYQWQKYPGCGGRDFSAVHGTFLPGGGSAAEGDVGPSHPLFQ